MAKVGGTFATQLRGKLGKTVFRMREGTNVVAQKPSEVKNPRTVAQQTQRMVMNTVIQAYSGLKEICDHSFEGYPTGSKCMGRFTSLNNDLMSQMSDSFNPKKFGYPLVNPYIISKGSLSEIRVYAVTRDDKEFMTFYGMGCRKQMYEGFTPATMTVDSFFKFMDCQAGDQLTFVLLAPGNDFQISEIGTQRVPSAHLELARVVFFDEISNPTEKIFLKKADSEDYIFNVNVIDMEKSKDFDKIQINHLSDTSLVFNFAFEEVDSEIQALGFAVGIIKSRKVGGTWLRSDCQLAITADGDTMPIGAALKTYDPKSNFYLNNAGV